MRLFKKLRQCPYCREVTIDTNGIYKSSRGLPYKCLSCSHHVTYYLFHGMVEDLLIFITGLFAVLLLIVGLWKFAIAITALGFFLCEVVSRIWPLRARPSNEDESVLTEDKNAEYLAKLNSLHKVFISIKLLHNCALPSEPYEISDPYFSYWGLEIKKLILGRLSIILFDNKHNSYNTISFKILIQSMRKHEEYKNCETLVHLFDKLKGLDEKYKTFRDKFYAHIELENNSSLKKMEALKISNKDITALLALAEEACDVLFLCIAKASSAHMAGEMDKLSIKLWRAYEVAGLATKKSDGEVKGGNY